MEKVYFYHFNILTQNIKVEEFEVVANWSDSCYRLATRRNNKIIKITKQISDFNTLVVERNGINISGCCSDKDKLDEFKALCIPHVIDYQNRCNETIKSMNEAIENCNRSLIVLY